MALNYDKAIGEANLWYAPVTDLLLLTAMASVLVHDRTRIKHLFTRIYNTFRPVQNQTNML